MKTLLLCSTLLACNAAIAAPDFDARITAAKAAVATRPGFIYDTAMVPAIHHALVPCVPKGNDPARGGDFVLVADVDRSGRASNIDVRPASPLARCFARTFAALTLRPPPLVPGQARYPVVVEMLTKP
ncbi:hypothetical protein DWG18_02170 [Lysobacter sp. TY2-98]|uniref:hypothetical protein n=1 Tax=Lysobacter sp. TY2-98 TaxID=2290922 RepID=UPI000E209714|nr:hypothetical protein [Lysobacter sp. TY2-98]AXK71206.1 hypothetical protein DWG18_02170 [Lysobacter sp. TY2-98]